jgi:hypothetical protein
VVCQLEATLPPLLDALAQQAAAIPDDDLRDAARERVADARDSYREARDGLLGAEREAAAQAEQATAAQRAAAAAQRDQAVLALEAAEGRTDDLVIEAPSSGTIELAPADGGGAGVPDLGGLAGQLGGGGAGGLEGGLPDVGGLLGGDGGGGEGGASGPVTEGVSLSPGQLVATVYDLSSFTARVDVDEIDVVEVEDGQAVTGARRRLPRRRAARDTSPHVAIAPVTGTATGGAVLPRRGRDSTTGAGGRGAAGRAHRQRRGRGPARRRRHHVVPTAALLRRGGAEVVYVVATAGAVEVPVDRRWRSGRMLTPRSRERWIPASVWSPRGVETVADGDSTVTPGDAAPVLLEARLDVERTYRLGPAW